MLDRIELAAIQTELVSLTKNERTLPLEQIVDLIAYRINLHYGLCLSLEGKEQLVKRLTE